MKIREALRESDDAVKLTRSSVQKAPQTAKQVSTPATGLLKNLEQDSVQVNISGLGRELGAIESSELTPTVRKEKVEKLKELIASGNYNISSQDVAKSIIQQTLYSGLDLAQNSKENIDKKA